MSKKLEDPKHNFVTIKLSNAELSSLNEMSVGNRSEFIRRLIEAEYQKRQEQK